MFSRRTILVLSFAIALMVSAAFLWIAPRITLLEADRIATQLATRFRLEFVDIPVEVRRPASAASRTGLDPAGMGVVFGEDPGTLAFEDALVAPPVETPRVSERTAAESIDRAYDLEPETAQMRKMDARILEITQEAARQDIQIARRLVRPSPEYSLPVEALPLLRSRDIAPEHIPLEPARIGPGLLAQTITPGDASADSHDEDPDAGKPSFEPDVFDGGAGAAAQVVPGLERVESRGPGIQEAARAREESDFIFMDDMVDIRIETYIPSAAAPGYFRLRILPRRDAALESLPKDITFIVDASRSIQQRKLDLIGRGISTAIERFRPEDRFNIMLFRDTVTSFQSEPVPATPENLRAAQSFLGTIESAGQTDLYNALLPIAQMRPRSNLPGIILIASDGNPTTGLRDSRTIINTVTTDNALRNSIFAYGAGRTVNRYLLDLIAYRNKGETLVSDRIEDASRDIANFIDRLGDPLLINLKTDYGRIDKTEIFPKIVPDFYRGRDITIYGRFDPQRDSAFVARITGQAGARAKEILFRADLREADGGGADIAQGWAFQKAYHLIGEISRHGEREDLVAELKNITSRYAIRTIYDE